jgi:hypothetical protein
MTIDDLTGKVNVTTVSAASMNAAVAAITTGSVTNLTATSASVASMNAGVALLTTATVTTLNASGASIASANIGNLQFTAASIASINAGVAVINNLTATSASIASANVGVALITTGTVTALTATGASVASANVGTAVITGLTVTGASIASVNAGTATLSGNLTLNGGTANGVLYLNGSKVATSGTALSYDGTVLTLTATDLPRVKFTGSTGGGDGWIDTFGTTLRLVNNTGSGATSILGNGQINISTAGGSPIVFTTSGSEQMRLTSTGLGIGTSSPGQKLEVAGNILINTSGNPTMTVKTSGAGNNPGYLLTADTNTWGMYGIFSDANDTLQWQYNGTTRLTLTNDGNLGLGVSPSAWGSIWKAQQLQVGAFIASQTNANDIIHVGTNAFANSSNAWTYINTAAATRYEQYQGAHKWYNAPSGTAGNAISFTQAMTLDADGELGVGTTSPTARVHAYSGTAMKQITVDGVGGIKTGINFANGGTTYGQIYFDNNSPYDMSVLQQFSTGSLILGTNNTERARITSGGDFLVGATATPSATVSGVMLRNPISSGASVFSSGTTNAASLIVFFNNNGQVGRIDVSGTATSYVTSSDRRLKENIIFADDAGAVIDAIEIVKHDWKSGGHVRFGMIAQDLHQVAPEAVSAGDDGEEIEKTWGVDYSKLVPMLVKEIQSLRARVAQLESK